MKKMILPPAALVAAAVLASAAGIGACRTGLEEMPDSGGAVLFFYVEDEEGRPVPLNPGTDPVYRRIELNGRGPAGGSFSLASIDPVCRISDLRAGQWVVEVRAFNLQEEVIASFFGPLQIGDHETRLDVLLESLGKSSTLHLKISWDSEVFSEALVRASLYGNGEVPLILEPGFAAGDLELGQGSSLLGVSFFSDHGETAGVFPFFTGPGMENHAFIEISLPAGDEGTVMGFAIEPRQLIPAVLEVRGSGPPFFTGREEFFFTGDPMEGEELRWFAGDKEVVACSGFGTDFAAAVEADEPGSKLMTAVRTGASPPSIAAGSLRVFFAEPYRVGPEVFFQQIDGPDGLRGLACSPCGKYIAAAGYSEDKLVLWRREPLSGGLELFCETEAESAQLLDGISDTCFSPAGNLLAAASKNSSSLILWDFSDPEALLGPDGLMEPATVLRASDPGMGALEGISAISFSADGRFLYAAASESDSLAAFKVTGDGLEVLQVLDAAGIGNGLFDGPEDIALSGAGFSGLSGEAGSFALAWAAVPCLGGDSLFIFQRDPQSGLLDPGTLSVFSDGVDETELLNGVHLVAFYGAHLYSSSYYDDAVCHFEWCPDAENPQNPDAGVWEYRGAWDSFDIAPGSSSGICPEVPVGDLEYSQEIAVSPDGLVLALAAGGNDGVCLFSRNPTDGSLSPLAAAVDGTTGLAGLGSAFGGPADPLNGLDGARSVVWSHDGKNLYCGAANSNTVSVFQEW